MPRYKIEGGQPLEGTITISGAKNAAVAIIPATLLVQGCCRIEKCAGYIRCTYFAGYFEANGRFRLPEVP